MKSKEKTKYNWWFYRGDSEQEMVCVLKALAEKLVGTKAFAVAFIRVQRIYQYCRFGHYSESYIHGKAAGYLGRQQDDMPRIMSTWVHLYRNDRAGLADIIGMENKSYVVELLYRLLYLRHAGSGDWIIRVDELNCIDWTVYTTNLDRHDARYFAAMATALLVCDYKTDEVVMAMDNLREALEETAKRRLDEIETLKREIAEKQKQLDELVGEMPKEGGR